MSFLICQRHHCTEKTGSRAIASGLICLNGRCGQAMKVMCEGCGDQHQQHSTDILSIEDVSFLLDRLLKLPVREMARPIGEALDVIKQVKLIKEFRKKIDALEKELQGEALLLIEQTESLVQEYAECKAKATVLSGVFSKIEEAGTYRQFFQNSERLLGGFAYNSKKDKLEFANTAIAQKEDKRVRTLANAKEKIEELRDYSMKIVEVILNNDDSDSDEEDVAHKRSHYQALKQEICLDSTREEELRMSQIRDCSDVCSCFGKSSSEKEIQTHSEVFQKEQEEKAEKKLTQLRQSEHDFKLKLHAVVREKDNLHRELSRWKEKFQQKRQAVVQLQAQARGSRGKSREDLVNRIIQIWSAADEGHDLH